MSTKTAAEMAKLYSMEAGQVKYLEGDWGPMKLKLDNPIIAGSAPGMQFKTFEEQWQAALGLQNPNVPKGFLGIDGCDCNTCKKARGLPPPGYGIPVADGAAPQFYNLTASNFKTQKARGFFCLAGTGLLTPGVETIDPYDGQTYILPQMLSTAEQKFGPKPFAEPMFARPCPIVPRHGFVESRQVRTLAEAENIYKHEVLPEDPDAEMILMRKLSGKYSAVAVNTGVSWGHSNDGVTGGGSSLTVPTPTARVQTWNEWLSQRTKSTAVMQKDLKDVGYVELVEDREKMWAVQVRNGPLLPGTVNYIPRKETVTRIIAGWIGLTLLEWEKRLKEEVKKNKGIPDGLVLQAVGTSLASHYCVHAIQLGIAVITDRYVTVGTPIEPTGNNPARLKTADLRKLKALISTIERQDFLCDVAHIDRPGTTSQICRVSNAVITAFGTIHAMTSWDASDHLQRLRAYALVTLPRVIFAACAGELRHWGRHVNGRMDRLGDPETNMPILEKALTVSRDYYHYEQRGGDAPKERAMNRDDVYVEAIKPLSMRVIAGHMQTMTRDFSADHWGNYSNYGGEKWQNVAKAGHRLALAVIQFKKRPSNSTWDEVVLAANAAIHTVHNGGKALNKWINERLMDQCSTIPAIAFMNLFAGSIVLNENFAVPQPIDSKKWTG